MKWVLRWRKGARTELADLWLKADSVMRKAITVASHQIDVALSNNPNNKGESRDKGRRVYFHAPLGVLFRVKPEVGEVIILHVWKFQD